MSGCMGTDKPRIAILMAVYEPRMDWLREQLLSLNAQTYPNLMLYVRDDCSPTVPYAEIEQCVQECITRFPYIMARNEKNEGSNLTFEQLTREAEGEYFAYCDQDDVWLPEKLTVLQKTMVRENALLVCSDVCVINGDGQYIANSIRKVRRHHKFYSGVNLFKRLLVKNFVIGCTMLIDALTAKNSIPFCPYMVHDQYLSLQAAISGGIISLNKQLISYRIHGRNQTGIMMGVFDKRSYYEQRIAPVLCQLNWLEEHLDLSDNQHKTLKQCQAWITARKTNWLNHVGMANVIKYCRFNGLVSFGELMLCRLPNNILSQVVTLARKNYI